MNKDDAELFRMTSSRFPLKKTNFAMMLVSKNTIKIDNIPMMLNDFLTKPAIQYGYYTIPDCKNYVFSWAISDHIAREAGMVQTIKNELSRYLNIWSKCISREFDLIVIDKKEYDYVKSVPDSIRLDLFSQHDTSVIVKSIHKIATKEFFNTSLSSFSVENDCGLKDKWSDIMLSERLYKFLWKRVDRFKIQHVKYSKKE